MLVQYCINNDELNFMRISCICSINADKEIEKYNIVDLKKTPISKTKMKFNAQGIIDSIKQRVSELPEIIEDVGTNQINKSIDLAKVAGSISNDHEIGKKAVDCMELSPENRLKEVKVDD